MRLRIVLTYSQTARISLGYYMILLIFVGYLLMNKYPKVFRFYGEILIYFLR